MALAPYEARGAEADPAADLAFGSTIYVVKPAEVGLVVRDVSQADDSANLVCNAHVKIISRYNGKTVEGTTDKDGALHLDISELAEEDGKKAMVPRYAFNATIEVSAQGYRDFRTGLYRVEGGTALAIPTQPKQPGLPYPVSTSFDNWDVLYTDGDASTFVSATGNDVNHTIGLLLDNLPAGANVTAGIFADGQRVAKTTVRAEADGRANVELKADFLRTGSASELPAGDDHEFTMRYIVSGTTYEVPIKLNVMQAPAEAQTSTIKKDMELVPFNDTSMFLGLTAPKSWPVIGGQKIKLWRPSFFADFCYDPFGFIMIKFSTPEWGYKYDSGKPDSNGWQVCSRKNPKEQFYNTIDAMGQNIEKSLGALGEKGQFHQVEFAHKFSFTEQLEFVAAAQWEFSEKESRGHARGTIRLGCNYSLAESFWAGPFPILIRFSVGLSVEASLMVAYVSPSVWKFSQYRWDYTSTGLETQIVIAPSLSLGVGINGVSSLSVKGSFSLTYWLHTGPKPKGYEKFPDVHVRLAGKAAATVEAEVLWFTQSWSLWNSDWDDWYNNWDGLEPKLNAPNVSAPLPERKSLSEAYDEAHIITAEDLDALAEFETGGLQAMLPQEKTFDRYALIERTAEGEKSLADLFLPQDEVAAFAAAPDVAVEGQDTAEQPTDESPAAVLGAAAAGQAGEGALASAGEGIVVESLGATLLSQADDQATTEPPAAQDDASEPAYILRKVGGAFGGSDELETNQLKGFVTQAPAVRPVGEHHYAELPSDVPGVLRLGFEQGFHPSTDICLADNILMSSRSKLFTVANADYVARIGVVRVNGQPRTRVICEQVGGTDRRVLDFASAYGRDDCFDYDFDIATITMGGTEIVNMVVISGTRDKGNATSFTSAATSTFFSFVSCVDWQGSSTFTGTTVTGRAVDAIGDDGQTFPERNYSCPRLVHLKGEKNGVEYYQAAVAYLERASRFDWAIMGSDPDLTRAGVGLVFFDSETHGISLNGLAPVRACVAREVADPTITEIALSGRADGHQVLELKGVDKVHYLLLETDPCRYVLAGHPIAWVDSVTVMDLGDYEGKVQRLIPMESGSYFLTCVDGMLKRLDVVSGAEGQPARLEFTDFGGDELNMNDFGVLEGGDVLYWPATREDGGYTFAGDGIDDPTLRKEEGGELHLIQAARVRGGKLSKSFNLCEVGHPMSRIRHYGNSEDHMSFISSNTVDLATGKGEQWYTAVPWVRCANLLESVPYDTVVAAGANLPFFVTLRNDGNCYLSGVELTVAEVGGDVIGTVRLDFGEDNLRPSQFNPTNEDGGMDNVEDDFALAPGMTSRYLMSGVAIPEGWQGQKDVEVFVTAAYGVTSGLLAAAAEDHSIEYLPDKREKMTLRLGQSDVEPYGNDDVFGAADVSVMGRGGNGGNGGNGKSNGGTGKSNGGNGSGGNGGSGNGGNGKSNGGNGGSKASSGAKANSSDSAKAGTASGNASSSNANGQSSGTSAQTAATGNSTPRTGDAVDAYKQGTMPRTGDPANLTAAAAVAIGGAASIAAAKALSAQDKRADADQAPEHDAE